jgi:hypothetical protein
MKTQQIKLLPVKKLPKSLENKRVPFLVSKHTRVRNDKASLIKERINNVKIYDKYYTEKSTDCYNRLTGNNVRFSTLVHYTGGKAKFYTEVQKVWDFYVDQSIIKQVLVPFLGGGSDMTNISPKIMGRVYTMIVNDYNPVICGLNINIRDNRDELKAAVQAIIDLDPITEDDKKAFINLLQEESQKIELTKDYNSIQLSAVYLVLQNISKNGIYEYDEKEGAGRYSTTTMKIENIKNCVKKIDFYGFFIDGYKNYIVENMSYDELIEKYGGEETFIVADPIYCEENHSEVPPEVLIKTSIDYGFDFDHEKCMEVFTTRLKGSQMVYHNYWNTRLINEFKKCGFEHKAHEKNNINTNLDGTKKTCIEVIIYTNYRKKPSTVKEIMIEEIVINNTEYQPMVNPLVQVS